jgi:hypothetical protein
MAATRQSTPPATKRKADETSPSSNKKKQQKTLEEVIPDASKREEVKAALVNEAEPSNSENGVQNGDGKQDTNGGAGTLFYNRCFLRWTADHSRS